MTEEKRREEKKDRALKSNIQEKEALLFWRPKSHTNLRKQTINF